MHHIADKLPEEAWDGLKQASDEREITDFKEVRNLPAGPRVETDGILDRQCKSSSRLFPT